MTTKKIARSKRSTKAKPRKGVTIGEILAERGVKADRPIPFTPTENPEIRRAAERSGIEQVKVEPDPYEAAMRHVTSRFAEALVKACDQLGEELASAAEWKARGEGDYDSDNVMDTLLTLWSLRWELGITPSHVSVDAKASDYAIEHAVNRVKKSESNGAAAETAVSS